jgi:hypothetical protein
MARRSSTSNRFLSIASIQRDDGKASSDWSGSSPSYAIRADSPTIWMCSRPSAVSSTWSSRSPQPGVGVWSPSSSYTKRSAVDGRLATALNRMGKGLSVSEQPADFTWKLLNKARTSSPPEKAGVQKVLKIASSRVRWVTLSRTSWRVETRPDL